ncbi:hypothetical protein KYI11_10890 [Macrococcoides bohemicum]|uniref:Uncharacterized protein n=2 Tax=Macrococcoides TaxID=3076173 RepID=A0AAJ4TWD1_9STAP|nr:hypothetical protein [Macrococcus]QYA42089.1 hypothetical protein KYI11_10890 [Macrococcus bohemicus]RAI79325.1 hypothetical protein BFS35_012255 [Macrococcus goetzii]TDL35711.1 hypothetical protein EVU91_11720 [Macrococcus bohemicus]
MASELKMTRKTGFLFDREGVQQCNVLPLKESMYQIVKVNDNPAIKTCGMDAKAFEQFKKANKLYFADELKQKTIFDYL